MVTQAQMVNLVDDRALNQASTIQTIFTSPEGNALYSAGNRSTSVKIKNEVWHLLDQRVLQPLPLPFVFSSLAQTSITHKEMGATYFKLDPCKD